MRFELCRGGGSGRDEDGRRHPGDRETPWENAALSWWWGGTRDGQSSRAVAPALARSEMRKSRSRSAPVADRRRAEARLGGGESLHNRHGAAAGWAKP